MVKLLRHLLALPTSILGALLLRISEYIAGDTLTYNAEEVLTHTKPTCSKCGHTGNIYLTKKP